MLGKLEASPDGGDGGLVPVVQRLRPQTAWPEVTVAVNVAMPVGGPGFTPGRLVSTARFLVSEGLVDAAV